MIDSLKQESEKLARSWLRHDQEMLRDYLVAGVEDPRVNLQSILTRHFLIRAADGDHYGALMEQEVRFSAVMNWLLELRARFRTAEDLQLVLGALKRGSDNAEGIDIPAFVLQTHRMLSPQAGDAAVPNYIEQFLREALDPPAKRTQTTDPLTRLAKPVQEPGAFDTFQQLWRAVLVGAKRLSALEAACGSANDYRILEAFGIAPLLDYTGFDICEKNVANARALFPNVRFDLGNVFEIAAPDRAFELCFAHDLFEHLSMEGLSAAVSEVCRVTRLGLCIGFFNMAEIPSHVIQPLDDYHWNTLSMASIKAQFAARGFAARVLHMDTLLRELIGCPGSHNPNAYTMIFWRESGA
jgi:SAM-dependent methyltransferase